LVIFGIFLGGRFRTRVWLDEYMVNVSEFMQSFHYLCWSHLCFFASLKFHILMLEIESWFSYFPLFFPKSQKSHRANSDGYRTLKADLFFNRLNKSLLLNLRMSHVGSYRSHSLQIPRGVTVK
jgi:hypothetical protein